MKKILVVLICLGLVGCATIGHREVVSATNIYKYSTEEAKFRIDQYLKANTQIDPKIKDALTKFFLVRGMTKEQVILIAGKANKVLTIENKSKETWFYNLGWSGLWGCARKYKLTFDDNFLVNIEEWRLESL